MEKALKLYTIVDGKEAPFPNTEQQIEIYDFKYDAKRMGGAPSITATIMHPTCLDDEWGDSVFVEFNQERYYLKQTPTSSKTNEDARWKHEVEFVSERISLDNVFFFDAVVGNPESYDKPVSNSSTFTFSGTITELASRLNASLEYCGLGGENGYKVFVDDGVDDGEQKLISIQNASISQAIQEGYNQFEIPHYFVGKEIHYGFFQDAVNNEDTSFKYGLKNELLSITKTNSNQKIITRITGTGSTENIPYYYPNEHPQGVLKPHLYDATGKEVQGAIGIGDENVFANNVLYTDVLTFVKREETTVNKNVQLYKKSEYLDYINTVGESKPFEKNAPYWYFAPSTNWNELYNEDWAIEKKTSALGVYKEYDENLGESISIDSKNRDIAFRISIDESYFYSKTEASDDGYTISVHISFDTQNVWRKNAFSIVYRGENKFATGQNVAGGVKTTDSGLNWYGEFHLTKEGLKNNLYDRAVYIVFESGDLPKNGVVVKPKMQFGFKNPPIKYGWQKNEKSSLWNIERYGLSFGSYNLPSNDNLLGYTIRFEQVAYVQPMQTLMPPVYWQSGGAERFYNAKNYPFTPTNDYVLNTSAGEYLGRDGRVYNGAFTGYVFANEYRINKRIEHICQFDDIKPTIENTLNNDNEPINEILDIAFDKDDNDLIDQEKNEYYHPYFYVKLRRFDGQYGFNLFTHANEKGEVTFAMKSGKCGACNFVLSVDSESGKNTVQVDNNGNLVYDGNKVKLGLAQDRQNDTTKNEVWIALRKDTQTFGHIMPSVQHNYYPEVGDKFVLLNISLPKAYVEAAEKKLEQEIIKYMHENNEEKFSISIKFSRIYFAENPDVLHRLNENSLIHVTYNNVPYSLYVDSFSYNMRSNEALPEVTVELTEALKLNANAIQNAVTQVKAEVLDRVSKMDIAALVASKYISKDNEDYARQKITFNRGLEVGTNENITARINEVGNADLESATLKKYLSTPQFTDGFNGSGFKLWLDENNLSHLTIDVLTARQRMDVYEMIISKIRSVNGEIWVSAANGKIKEVAEFDNYYEVVIDGTNLFQDGDFARCQVFSEGSQRFYWVELGEIVGNRIKIAKTEFIDSLPSVNDELVLCGSRNTNRQNAILISAAEDGQPRIDIMNGINSKTLDGCIRTRLGKLDGINDSAFGKKQPHGDGLYGDNVYLKGEFVLNNRNVSVDTLFAITEEGIKASVEQTQAEAIKGKTLLYNASFTNGLKGWMTSNIDSTYFSGTSMLFASGSILSQSVTVSNEPVYDNVFFVNIKNGWIKQSNLYFVNKPEFDGVSFYPLSFSANVRCKTEGVLTVKLVGTQYTTTTASKDYEQSDIYGFGTAFNFKAFVVNKHIAKGDVLLIKDDKIYNLTKQEYFTAEYKNTTTFEILESVKVEDLPILTRNIQPNEKFVEINTDLMWDGQGDFYLSFSGEADFYGLTIYTEKTEVRHKAIFEVEAGLSKFAQQNIGNDGNILQESGLLVKPTGSEIYAVGNNGYASIGAYEDGKVKLTGEKIILEGDISANGYVHIDAKTGKLTAKDAEITGNLSAGTIGDFTINKQISSAGKYSNLMLHNSGLSIVNGEGQARMATPLCIDTPNAYKGTAAIYINTKKEEHSIVVRNGNVKFDSAIVSHTTVINANTTTNESGKIVLSPYDNIILFNNTQEITVQLPTEPEDGQIYRLKKISGYKVVLCSATNAKIQYVTEQNNAEVFKEVETVDLVKNSIWRTVVWCESLNLWILGE